MELYRILSYFYNETKYLCFYASFSNNPYFTKNTLIMFAH